MRSSDFQNLGTYLQAKRLATGLTQAELAEKVNINAQYVSNWERGICAPPSHCFHQLLDVLQANRKKIVAVMLLDSKLLIEAKIFNSNKIKGAA